MQSFKEFLNETIDSSLYKHIRIENGKYKPKDKDELLQLVRNTKIHLGDIDTSDITDMSRLFYMGTYSTNSRSADSFKGIETWDVSKVKDMEGMFNTCVNFNSDISKWNISNVESTALMFCGCKKFNQNISRWNIKKVKDMEFMLYKCESFNQDLSGWDLTKNNHTTDAFSETGMKSEYLPKGY